MIYIYILYYIFVSFLEFPRILGPYSLQKLDQRMGKERERRLVCVLIIFGRRNDTECKGMKALSKVLKLSYFKMQGS